MNNVFYGLAPVKKGLFILNLESETQIHNTDAKRRKTNDEIPHICGTAG